MTPANEFPFVPRHEIAEIDDWFDDLNHVAHLREIVHQQGLAASALGDLLDYEVRLALIASLFPNEKATLYQAVARGAGVAHAAMLSQRRWFGEAQGTVSMAEPGKPPVSFGVDDAGLAAPAWVNGLSLALIARDYAAINTLAAPATIDACQQPAEKIDSFWQPYCAAFAAAIIEPEAAAQWIEIAVSALGEARISASDRVERVHYPLLPVLAALAERNGVAFNAALFDALQRLHTYYSHPDQYRDWNGHFSLALNGICAAASDLGLPIEVASDYLLHDLISGDFPRSLTTVTLHYPLRAIADADEARWFLDLEGIAPQYRQHVIVERDHELIARYEINDAPGLSHAIAEFILPSAANEGTESYGSRDPHSTRGNCSTWQKFTAAARPEMIWRRISSSMVICSMPFTAPSWRCAACLRTGRQSSSIRSAGGHTLRQSRDDLIVSG